MKRFVALGIIALLAVALLSLPASALAGTIIWQEDIGTNNLEAAAVLDDQLIITSSSGEVYSRSSIDGSADWLSSSNSLTVLSVDIDEDFIAAGDSSDRVVRYDRSGGTDWTRDLDSFVYGLAIGDSAIIAATSSGDMHALAKQDGSTLDQVDQTGRARSAAANGDDYYVGYLDSEEVVQYQFAAGSLSQSNAFAANENIRAVAVDESSNRVAAVGEETLYLLDSDLSLIDDADLSEFGSPFARDITFDEDFIGVAADDSLFVFTVGGDVNFAYEETFSSSAQGLTDDGEAFYVALNNGDFAAIDMGKVSVANPNPTAGNFVSPVSLSVDVSDRHPAADTEVTFEGDGSTIEQTTITGSQTATVDWPYDESQAATWRGGHEPSNTWSDLQTINTQPPELSNPQPEDGSIAEESNIELSVDVDDPDFDSAAGDEVTVTFYDNDDEEIGSDTLTESGTATTTWDAPNIDENMWYVEAEDDYGNTADLGPFSIFTPSEIEIFNESSPDQLVETNADATVTFFGGDEVFERDVENGVVDMSGLPNEEFVISVNVDGYVTRQTIIESIIEQQEVYLLPEEVDAVDVRFRLSDPTGQFVEEDSRLFIERPITRDGSTIYRTIAADEFGANGYGVLLERDQRYRLRVQNEDGNERTFTFTAQTDESVELEISAIEFQFEAEDVFQWDASMISNDSLRFAYQDPTGETDAVELTITNRTSNEEITAITLDGAEGTHTETIEGATESDAFIVEWEAFRGDDSISGGTTVGQSQLGVMIPGVSEEVLGYIGLIGTLMLAGAFSRVNAQAGPPIVAVAAGGFWIIGWMPAAVSGIFIAIAIMVAVLFNVAFSGGGPR